MLMGGRSPKESLKRKLIVTCMILLTQHPTRVNLDHVPPLLKYRETSAPVVAKIVLVHGKDKQAFLKAFTITSVADPCHITLCGLCDLFHYKQRIIGQ